MLFLALQTKYVKKICSHIYIYKSITYIVIMFFLTYWYFLTIFIFTTTGKN